MASKPIPIDLGDMTESAGRMRTEGDYDTLDEVVQGGLRALEREREVFNTMLRTKVREALNDPRPSIPIKERLRKSGGGLPCAGDDDPRGRPVGVSARRRVGAGKLDCRACWRGYCRPIRRPHRTADRKTRRVFEPWLTASEIVAGVRSFTFERRQIVLYRVEPAQVEVLRVIDASRDFYAALDT